MPPPHQERQTKNKHPGDYSSVHGIQNLIFDSCLNKQSFEKELTGRVISSSVCTVCISKGINWNYTIIIVFKSKNFVRQIVNKSFLDFWNKSRSKELLNLSQKSLNS